MLISFIWFFVYEKETYFTIQGIITVIIISLVIPPILIIIFSIFILYHYLDAFKDFINYKKGLK